MVSYFWGLEHRLSLLILGGNMSSTIHSRGVFQLVALQSKVWSTAVVVVVLASRGYLDVTSSLIDATRLIVERA